MKRWEEQQRKKNYNNKISQAKATLVTQPTKTKVKHHPPSEGYQDQYILSSPSMGGGNGLVTYGSPMIGSVGISGGPPAYTYDTPGSSYGKRQEMPIFQLLKAFKLQQYAGKLTEIGYGQDIYKLALLNDNQRHELIGQLKVLPGHKAKLMSLFDVIDEIYPKKMVVEQLRQYTPNTAKSNKRVQSAAQGFRGGNLRSQQQSRGFTSQHPRSLIHQYEALDPQTKQAFNSTFLMNLESVKYSIPQLFAQHFNNEDRANAINHIFPPNQYFSLPSNASMDGWSQSTQNYQCPYDPVEMEQLVNKYVGRAAAQQPQQQANTKRTSSSNRQQQQQESAAQLKVEMAHTMKVIERINKEFEQMTKASQQEYDQIRAIQAKQGKRSVEKRSYQKQNSLQDSSSVNKKNVTSTSLQSTKPNSVQSSKRTSNVLPRQQKPPVPQQQQQQQQDQVGRFQSNRALARERQQLMRVITEHEVASEMTTPHKPDTQPTTTPCIVQSTDKKPQQVPPLPSEQQKMGSEKMEVDGEEEKKLGNSEEQVEEKLEYKEDEENEEESDSSSEAEIIVSNNLNSSPVKPQIPYQKPERKLSPLLEREERDLLWNNALGHSLDSKQVASALGYLDLKQICLCLAHALNKHIQFSQGFYFLDDLQEQIKALHLEDHLRLDFSYDLDLKLLDINKKTKPSESESTKREFEELKEKVKEGGPPVFEYKRSYVDDGGEDQFERADNCTADVEFEVDEEEIVDKQDEQYIQDYYGNNSESNNRLEKAHIPKILVNDTLPPQQVEEEPIDLDYSYSHLEDFLRSQKNSVLGGASAQPLGTINNKQQQTTTTQQLMNTFLTSYNKNKGGISHRTNNNQGEVILEASKGGESEASSTMKIDVRTKEGFKDLIRFQMRIFDYNYDFLSDQIIEEQLVSDEFPTIEELYYYCKYVIISGRMEKEIPILCLVYIERFLTKTGILLNHLNWRRITLISLTLASKIWDDDSLENVHFPKVMPDITLKEIASLEKVFLQFMDFDLIMRGAEYAKYYFILKTFAKDQGFNSCLPPVGPLTAQKMSELQNNTVKVESELRDKYEIRLSLQKTM